MTPEPSKIPARASAPPSPPSNPRPACPGLTKAGQPCPMRSVTASGRCINHDPRFTTKDRSSWGERGAMSNLKRKTIDQLVTAAAALPEPAGAPVPSFATAATVRTYLERMSQKVEDSKLAPSQAGAIARFAELAIKLAELELERQTLDLEIAAQERGDDRRGPRVSLVR